MGFVLNVKTNMKIKWLYVITGILLVTILSFIFFKAGLFKQPTKTQPSNKKLQVSTSFYPLYFFSSQIGKDKATVRNITPAGAEPHEYEPTPQEIAQILQSKIVVVNGAGFETWYKKGIDSLLKDSFLVSVTGDMELLGKDPHVWLSPVLAKQQADRILTAYTQVDPYNSDYYKTNTEKLRKQFDKLDEDFKTGLKSCQKKEFITSHAAFAYLAQEYGLNQVAISGLSPDTEPPTQQLAEITNFAKKNSIKYIFFESLVSPKLSETIANEIGAKTLVLDPIEGLSDEDIKGGKDYFTVMQDNLKNLQIALECNL